MSKVYAGTWYDIAIRSVVGGWKLHSRFQPIASGSRANRTLSDKGRVADDSRILGIAMSILPVVYESTTRQLTGRFRGRERNRDISSTIRCARLYPTSYITVTEELTGTCTVCRLYDQVDWFQIVEQPTSIGLVVTRKPIRIWSGLYKAAFTLECAVDVTE